MRSNPNAGKRRRNYGGWRTPRSNAPRGSGSNTTGVTLYRVDPAYLARYGAELATLRANENARTGRTTGGATVLARNATQARKG